MIVFQRIKFDLHDAVKDLVQTCRQAGADVARLARAGADETLGDGGRQHHQRHTDHRQKCPDRINRNGDTHQDHQPHQIAARAGDHRAPDIADRVHIRLHPLHKKTGRVVLVKGTVLLHHPVEQVDAQIRRCALCHAGQQHLLHHRGQRAQRKDRHQHQPHPNQRTLVAADKDAVEHRLHQLGQHAQSRAFDDHEDHRDGHQAGVFL